MSSTGATDDRPQAESAALSRLRPGAAARLGSGRVLQRRLLGQGGAAMMADLPPHVRAEVQLILDAEARRLLAAQVDRDPLGAPAAGRDYRAVNDGANEAASSRQG